jgi:hypothetical protein
METGEDGDTGKMEASWRCRRGKYGDVGGMREEGMIGRRDDEERSAWEKRIVTGKLCETKIYENHEIFRENLSATCEKGPFLWRYFDDMKFFRFSGKCIILPRFSRNKVFCNQYFFLKVSQKYML